ncbi:MAG TPA: oleate hydratase, partial [Lachnospiraceae bacterium]|nr:oleate hydratase [Lachnospiraceae bacterium]
YGLYTDVPGDYVKKPMKECTGREIVEEWLYHMGVPEADIKELASTGAHCIPCMMPYITAFFMPRREGDRPKVVPDGCVNFAFLGQFADTVRDTVFTTEYSVRTAMEAVYTLLHVDRGVPEVFGSCYDIRVLLDSTAKMLDGKKLTDIKLPLIAGLVEKKMLKKVSGTIIEELLERYHLI